MEEGEEGSPTPPSFPSPPLREGCSAGSGIEAVREEAESDPRVFLSSFSSALFTFFLDFFPFSFFIFFSMGVLASHATSSATVVAIPSRLSSSASSCVCSQEAEEAGGPLAFRSKTSGGDAPLRTSVERRGDKEDEWEL